MHKMPKHILEKKKLENFLKMLSAEIFIRHAKHFWPKLNGILVSKQTK